MTNASSHAEAELFSAPQSNDVAVRSRLDQHTNSLGGLVKYGRVVEPSEDETPPGDIPRVLVQVGGNIPNSYTRNWMPWVNARAGYDGEWWVPEVDEQVLVVAPSGNLVLGVIIGSLYRGGALTFESGQEGIKPGAEYPLPVASVGREASDIHKRVYKDGTSISYDRKNHHLEMTLKKSADAESAITISCVADDFVRLSAGSTHITIKKDGASVTIEGQVKIIGTLDVVDG